MMGYNNYNQGYNKLFTQVSYVDLKMCFKSLIKINFLLK